MVPLPEHERAKVIIRNLVKILLDELNLNRESLGSMTFKREDMEFLYFGDEPHNLNNSSIESIPQVGERTDW